LQQINDSCIAVSKERGSFGGVMACDIRENENCVEKMNKVKKF
jgi:hypothetical protein